MLTSEMLSPTTVPNVTIGIKVKGYIQLMKLRLSFLVVFSAGITYLFATDSPLKIGAFVMFLLGAIFITGAANTINQIIEVRYDKLMKRTAIRPLPTGVLSVQEAGGFAFIIGSLGFLLLIAAANGLTALLALFSLFSYAFVYTPMKRVSPIAVFIGAFPGAMPPLIGWTAATGEISLYGVIFFAIQFIWQFPHFWAIAWVLDEDYKKAGFRLLPDEKNKNTAVQIIIYTLLLLPLGILPTYFGTTGIVSAVIATVCGLLFLIPTFQLWQSCTNKAAKMIMFGSFFYLPIVQIAYLLDKV